MKLLHDVNCRLLVIKINYRYSSAPTKSSLPFSRFCFFFRSRSSRAKSMLIWRTSVNINLKIFSRKMPESEAMIFFGKLKSLARNRALKMTCFWPGWKKKILPRRKIKFETRFKVSADFFTRWDAASVGRKSVIRVILIASCCLISYQAVWRKFLDQRVIDLAIKIVNFIVNICCLKFSYHRLGQ